MKPAEMPIEFEVKFYPVDKKEIVAKLQALGAELIQPEVITKAIIFNRTANRQVVADYIRVRHEGNKSKLSAKVHAKHDGDIADQKEVETVISDFEATVQILKQAGLKQSSHMEKYRETWQLGTSEIVIDTCPGLQTYIEIEDHSEQAVHATAEKLGFSWQDKIITSVVEIYMKVFNLSAEKTLELFRRNTFDENPFKDLPKQ